MLNQYCIAIWEDTHHPRLQYTLHFSFIRNVINKLMKL